MPNLTILPGVLAVLLFPSRATGLQEKPARQEPQTIPEMSGEVRGAIERGLEWLSKAQSQNGAYGSGSAPVATTSIAAMAFLVGGHLPARSRYGENVKRALSFLLKNAGRNGYINEGQARNSGGSGMHGHGYAAMFLAECYGMIDDLPDIDPETLKDRLSSAIRLIERSQCLNGGWNYEPTPAYDEGSVTVTQVQALRAARNAGIKVDLRTIEKALDYINKSTDHRGMTRYSLTSSNHTSFALTAAGMSVLSFLGSYENPKIQNGLEYVIRNRPGGGGNNANLGAWGGWYFYANYYATLACYQAGNPYWEKWWPTIRKDLILTQAPNGAWRQGESAAYGEAFGTGLALQILQIPIRYSPIYQRGSD